MTGARYAIYFVPDAETDLYRFGSAVIGYDCYRGAEIASLAAIESCVRDWADLTHEPRTYGFHATLKAPFRLAEGVQESDLRSALDRLAAQFCAASAFEPQVEMIGSFVAIVPERLPLALADLANACVLEFEAFRAPLSDQERRRRIAAGLDDDEIANLDRWGYPYVFNEFRFHMTLTGRLAPDRSRDIQAQLAFLFEQEVGRRPIAVDRLVLLRQASPEERFEVVRVAPVGVALSD
jgi:putative phosphonate metabolism protein